MLNKFPQRLKELRKQKGMFQQDLANIVGYSQGTITGLERGIREPGIDAILKLAEFFDVTTDYLLGATDI